MLGRDFLPVYNLFDLHNPLLLTAPNVLTPPPVQTTAPLSSPPACPDATRSAPKYLYLLKPGRYIKPDMGDPPSGYDAQFETEARTDPHEKSNESVKLLARQFILMACDTPTYEAISQEWNRLLETAMATTPMTVTSNTVTTVSGVPPLTLTHVETKTDITGTATTLTPRNSVCHVLPGNPDFISTVPYVHGLFAGKSFVEMRNHFSFNGHPVEEGARLNETLGQALAANAGAHVNMADRPGQEPLLRWWRPPHPSRMTLGTNTLEILFDTTSSTVLDQAVLREGDELYVRSIWAAVR